MSRVGIIKSVDSDNKVVNILGFGVFLESILFMDDTIGVEISVPKVQLDSGEVIENTEGYFWADEEAIKHRIEEYQSRGFDVNY